MSRKYLAAVAVGIGAAGLLGYGIGMTLETEKYRKRAELAEMTILMDRKGTDELLARAKMMLRETVDERGKAEVQRDAALRMVDRLRAQKPTLDAVRRAWRIEGRLECAVVPHGADRVAPETFLAR